MQGVNIRLDVVRRRCEAALSETKAYSPDQMGALVRETFRAMVDRVEHQFDDVDLILSQWLTLKLVGSGRIGCIGDVNRELGLESGSSTRLVDQLENRGLLVRERSAIDRRVVGISLTEQGGVVIESMQPRLFRFWDEQLSQFSVEEREQLFKLLARLRDSLVTEVGVARCKTAA